MILAAIAGLVSRPPYVRQPEIARLPPMAGITLAQAQTQLDAYLAAESAVLSNQSYEIHGRKLTRANLAEIQKGMEIWNQRVMRLSRRSAGVASAIVPRPRF
jgi:hypothetical protein